MNSVVGLEEEEEEDYYLSSIENVINMKVKKDYVMVMILMINCYYVKLLITYVLHMEFLVGCFTVMMACQHALAVACCAVVLGAATVARRTFIRDVK